MVRSGGGGRDIYISAGENLWRGREGGEIEQDPRVEGTTVVAEPPGTKIVGRSSEGLSTVFTGAAAAVD